MKMQLCGLIFAGILSGSVLAADEHNHENQAQADNAMAPGMMMGMMNHEQMMQMHEHMQQMQQLMTEITAVNDPDRRMSMMEQHMEQMNESMGMMGGAMMGRSGNGDMSGMEMQERMDMMQNQMGMMGMMMQQMMEHFSADEGHHGE